MNYLIFIDLVARAVAIVLAIYFIFILLFGDSKYKRHAFVLVMYSVVYYFMPTLDQTSLTYKASYMQDISVSMMIEGAAGVAMLLCMPIDKLAKFQALILAFAVMCHIMVYCHYQESPKQILTIAYGFQVFYDELIILVGLMQMAVSYNGLITAYNNALRKLQSFVFWTGVYSNHLRKYLSEREKRETKT